MRLDEGFRRETIQRRVGVTFRRIDVRPLPHLKVQMRQIRALASAHRADLSTTLNHLAGLHVQEVPERMKTEAEPWSALAPTSSVNAPTAAESPERATETPNWSKLAPDQRESLEMVAHKIGRILNGDPDYHDSWRDIVGYAKLVADRLA